ncbi:MAG TPA: hypothetical protein VF452_20895 [Candidatus Binatia bacterium]|jgi:hypothetical protein
MKRLFSTGNGSSGSQSGPKVLTRLLREMEALGLIRLGDLDRRDEPKRDAA